MNHNACTLIIESFSGTQLAVGRGIIDFAPAPSTRSVAYNASSNLASAPSTASGIKSLSEVYDSSHLDSIDLISEVPELSQFHIKLI